MEKAETFITEHNFETFHLTTTKSCGNMKYEINRNNFCKSIGIDSKKIVFANQVHGTSVKKVSIRDCGKTIDLCDGLITNDKNIILCIFTADCMPVFLASRDYSVVAMVHAGWRGLAGGIIESATIRFLEDFGISPCDIFAYIGPHISKCCYQVGDELKKAFNRPDDEEYFSLSQEAQSQMKKLGIKRIFINSHCTCHEYEMFYSYRREPTGKRIMSLIKCK
ncbi:MAG: peptidoglycan editing factor PgeF [Endomicrobiaceae bacterium]|nr:peptidoglycan editing factor PgeF [Endomicrobiaceae bacterium]